MANTLINGPQGETPAASPAPASDLVPTWGYAPDGRSEIHQLAPGAALPDGWFDHPDKAAAAKPRPKK